MKRKISLLNLSKQEVSKKQMSSIKGGVVKKSCSCMCDPNVHTQFEHNWDHSYDYPPAG
jgi:natural product precursor